MAATSIAAGAPTTAEGPNLELNIEGSALMVTVRDDDSSSRYAIDLEESGALISLARTRLLLDASMSTEYSFELQFRLFVEVVESENAPDFQRKIFEIYLDGGSGDCEAYMYDREELPLGRATCSPASVID